MPLRSVEAASRDDAIAAAREQFGPQARVVGVRRVRSGGVLGFFATERYVAEVAEPAPATAPRPTVPARPDDGAAPADFSSPLASAAPARARAAAPARNGAAAWAAAARPDDDIPEAVRLAAAAARAERTAAPPRGTGPAAADRAPAPAWAGAGSSSGMARTSASAARPVDDDRVSELVGLLTAQQQSEAAAPVYSRVEFPRGSAPRTGPASRPAPVLDDGDLAGPAPGGGQKVIPAAAPATPSPFTAALARMVAGDQDVRQAVQDALARPAEARPRADAEPWPVRSESSRTAQTSVPPVADQEEDTVGEQVVAPPSPADRPVEVPTWAATPEAAAVSPREEAIAEILRGALAQGHSDEALAGILRKVLAGASPQAALAEPVATPAEPVFAVPSHPVPAPAPPVAEPVLDLPVRDLPVAELPVPPAPAVAEPVLDLPVRDLPVAELPVPPAPAVAEPVLDLPVRDLPVAELPVPPAPAVAEPVLDLPVRDLPVAELPVPPAPAVAEPVLDLPVRDLPVAELPVPEAPAPAVDEQPVAIAEPLPAEFAVPDLPPVTTAAEATTPTEMPTAPEPLPAPAPAVPPAATGSMWGTPTSSSLWGDVTPAPRPRVDDAPIWAEVTQQPADPELFPTAPEPVAEITVPAADDDVIVAVAVATVEQGPTEETAADDVPDAPVGEDPAAEAEELVEVEVEEAAEVAELAPVLARTASDPAPMMSLDATTVMPPLSLLPPLPSSRGRGRPPVPPAAPRRPSVPAPSASPAAIAPAPAAPATESGEPAAPEASPAADPAVDAPKADRAEGPGRWLATVTRLPVAPLMAGPDLPELPEDFDSLCAQELLETPDVAADLPVPAADTGDVSGRLQLLGVPAQLLDARFEEDVVALGTYAALTRSLARRLPAAPDLPRAAGDTVFVVGPGADALRAARSLAASLHLDPDCVQWATRGDLAGLAPRSSRVTSVDAAIDRRQESLATGTVTIVAVDAPLRTDAYWMAQMASVWAPVAVWAVVEATRKPEDLEHWIDGLPRVDALIVQDVDLSADPAAVLRRIDAPVALLDGVRATPHRWASLLCERLDSTTA